MCESVCETEKTKRELKRERVYVCMLEMRDQIDRERVRVKDCLRDIENIIL